MPRPSRIDDRFTFGGRVPGPIGILIAITLLVSLVAAFTSRHGANLHELAILLPERVWQGDLWRLATWGFIEDDPISLLFACLLLYWFGRDLSQAWGARRFVAVYAGIAVLAAAGTCLVGLVDGDVMAHEYLGNWALASAMSVGWGLLYPTRQMMFYFVIPITGRVLVYLTIGMTALFAIYFGWERYIPSLLSMGLMAAWLYRGTLARWARETGFWRDRQARKRRVATVTHLRPVPRPRDDDQTLDSEDDA